MHGFVGCGGRCCASRRADDGSGFAERSDGRSRPDRLLIQLPAFRRVGLRAWADFSRQADLRTGAFWYPPLAIGGTALSIAAAMKNRGQAARLPLLATAGFAAAGLLVTVKAAPNMLRLKDGDNNPERLRGSFDGFRNWSGLREAFQALAFGASLWALAKG